MTESTKPAESFTCPVCGATSHNPHDVRWGYCGACHDWTGTTITQLTLEQDGDEP